MPSNNPLARLLVVDDDLLLRDMAGRSLRHAGFDVTEVEGRDGRVDLGALWMRGLPGMELRLEVEQETQQVNAAFNQAIPMPAILNWLAAQGLPPLEQP